ncbi:Transmembrane protein [Wickerhamomyces ciferrii]|uniref:Transmembrane 9 superfamily member n=1 Tax=Wickerhamomyces ciferrii (strain ATCC 14091 / BCRC 22168 / CBS 111 / JCM 3599 / NBRC 0793 / NRRL Y-1031 F-60-10) TaxID=1206466 RepID=K0KSQ5_WICCF|nr:Transmembrane protein [Wickerhamomyces ciferrii]CCH46191.1 Transmembrane protein [Wickerhamomyces ciferrii]
MVQIISKILAFTLALQITNAKNLYLKDESVPISVKPLTPGGNSHDDKLYLYPIDYYNPTLDSCAPKDQNDPYNLLKPINYTYQEDEFFGNHFQNAPIATTFQNGSAKCAHICDKNYNEANVTLINNLIKRNYKLNFFIDDVPVGRELYDSQTKKFYIDNGVPMGYLDLDKIPHLFNHFQFVVYYVSYGLEYEILYATVSTRSISRVPVVPLACMLTPPLMLRYNDNSYNGNRVSYDILWKEVHVNKWNDKWELYHNDVVKPFISNAVVVIFSVLTLIVAFYTYLTASNAINTEKLEFIYKTRQKSKTIDENNESLERSSSSDDTFDEIEFSWPSLINDVFRIPSASPLLYALVANGIHLTIVMTSIILILGVGAIDTHSFENKVAKTIVSAYILTTPIPSLINTYFFKKFATSSSSVDSFKKRLTQTVLLNSFALPVLTFIYIRFFNNAYASVESPTHISWKVYEHVSTYYIGITLVTFFIGLKFLKVQPYPSSDIAKKVSALPITFQPIPNMIISGIFPFGVILIPLSSVYITLWYSHFYSNNTLTISYLLLLTLTTAISILNVYHSLSIGNWKWQWYSFLSGFAVGIYTFIYSFYLTKFRFGDHASMVIFLLQNIAISSLLGLIGGSVAFIASLYFVKNLYSGLVN